MNVPIRSYGYDPRGQVLTARRSHRLGDQSLSTLDASVWGGEPMVFNDIGARGSSPLNRLESLTNAAVPLWGMAPAAETVLIDGTAASRDRAVFWRLYDPDTSTGNPPQWRSVSLSAASGAWQQSGYLYVPPLEETFAYDDDGNLTQNGRWDYGWDAENRLVSVTTRSGAVTAGAPELRLTFAYDARSRRVRKVVERKESGSWVTKSDVRFVYDGWNLVAEVEYQSGAADAPKNGAVAQTAAFLRRSYVWGPDVSGTMDGAGGVGGLLSVTRHERGTRGAETYWTTMDLNGNVIGLVGTASSRVAVYEYDAYGKCVRANEPEEGLNPVRFSTKYTDPETDLSYYGYRHYSARMRQWLSKDPIGEVGGVNLYGMVGNDPVCSTDTLGLLKGILDYAQKSNDERFEYHYIFTGNANEAVRQEIRVRIVFKSSGKVIGVYGRSWKEVNILDSDGKMHGRLDRHAVNISEIINRPEIKPYVCGNQALSPICSFEGEQEFKNFQSPKLIKKPQKNFYLEDWSAGLFQPAESQGPISVHVAPLMPLEVISSGGAPSIGVTHKFSGTISRANCKAKIVQYPAEEDYK